MRTKTKQDSNENRYSVIDSQRMLEDASENVVIIDIEKNAGISDEKV